MIDKLLFFFDFVTPTQAMIGVVLMFGMVALMWSRFGLGVYVALFFVATAFATAGRLRMVAPFLALLPAFFTLPILIRVLITPDRPRWSGISVAWLVVMLVFAFRSVLSVTGMTAFFWGIYQVGIMATALAVGTLMASPTYRMTIVRWLAYASTATVLLGFAAVVLRPGEAFMQWRMTPWGMQANIWGPTSLVCFLNCFLYLQLSRGVGMRLPKVAMAVLSGVAIIASVSRGAIVAWVLGLLAFWMVAKGERAKHTWILGVLGAGIAAAMFWGLSRGFLETEGYRRLTDYRSEGREEVHRVLITEYVMPNPVFGIGFFQKYAVGDVMRGDPHNSFLLIWIEQGTVGLLVVMVLLFMTYQAWRKCTRVWPVGSDERKMTSHAFMAFTALLFDALTVPHLWTHHSVLGLDFAVRVGAITALATTYLMQARAAHRRAQRAMLARAAAVAAAEEQAGRRPEIGPAGAPGA